MRLAREREIAARAETAREKVAELTALLNGFDTGAEEIRTTRKALLELPDPEPPPPSPAVKLPDHSTCQESMVVFAAVRATSPRTPHRPAGCTDPRS
ncbi:hypothetical protein [Streptacidiphilus sp. MAP5-3]|uniref:hypothetical protein n=1 Tax=unclassified Streptacidiphilus TaxID=2643834 RepID=UPI0035132BBB